MQIYIERMVGENFHLDVEEENSVESIKMKIYNILSIDPDQQWNTGANSRSEINDYGCYNVIRHREPVKFANLTAYRSHCVECYGHEKGIGGRRK